MSRPLLAAVCLALCLARPSAAQPAGDRPPPIAIDAATRTRVIDAVLRELGRAYVFPEKVPPLEQLLRQRLKAGAYDALSEGRAFSAQLTADLQSVTHDKHLRVFAFDGPPPPFLAPADVRDAGAMAASSALINHGFERAERLHGNLGYLQINMLMPPELAGATAAAAMAFVADTDALILDLRENGGGEPDMIALLCTYLFPGEPVHLNDLWERTSGNTRQYWTLPSVPGKRYGTKDVYVLTSDQTFSGAEELAYDLQTLKRATLIGKTTGGGAHPVEPVRLDAHFVAMLPYARAINPVTKTNWEGVGVKPEVAVEPAQALEVARRMALEKLLSHPRSPQHAAMLRRALAELSPVQVTGAARSGSPR